MCRECMARRACELSGATWAEFTEFMQSGRSGGCGRAASEGKAKVAVHFAVSVDVVNEFSFEGVIPPTFVRTCVVESFDVEGSDAGVVSGNG